MDEMKTQPKRKRAMKIMFPGFQWGYSPTGQCKWKAYLHKLRSPAHQFCPQCQFGLLAAPLHSFPSLGRV